MVMEGYVLVSLFQIFKDCTMVESLKNIWVKSEETSLYLHSCPFGVFTINRTSFQMLRKLMWSYIAPLLI
jgi:hypothetical protein